MFSNYPPTGSLPINHLLLLKVDPTLTKLVLETNSREEVEEQTKFNIEVFRKVLTKNAPNLCELYFTGTIHGITDSKTIWQRKIYESVNVTLIPQLNLKKIGIKLQYNRDDYPQVLGYNEEFLTELFEASPLLESLILTSEYDSEENESKILRALIDAKEGKLGNINELQFRKANSNTMGLIATQFKSPSLKNLIINDAKDLDAETFTRILENHKGTLEHLKFLFKTGYLELIFPGPLEKLTKLEFGAYYAYTPEPFFVGGTIQGDTFPNLITLDLIDGISSRAHSPRGTRLFDLEELFPKDGKPITTLRNLSLPPLITSEGLRRSSTLFPGLKKLTLGPQRSQMIAELWNMWNNTLEILTISLQSEYFLGHSEEEDECSYDSMITGLPDTFIEEIKENLRTDGQLPNVKVATLFPHRASITNMKRLSHIHFHNGPRLGVLSAWTPPSKFTDLSFQLGFGQLKDLEILVICKDVVEVSIPVINEICHLRGLEQVNQRVSLSLVKFNYQARNLQSGLAFAMPFESLSLT